MLSDEEKELIEKIQKGNKIGIYELIRTFKREGIENFITVRRRYIDIMINLIEKQSKEIEHQKEKRANQKKELATLNAKQIEFNKLVNTVNSYKGQFKRQQKEIEELKNADLTTVYLNGFYDGEKKVKDKIKAKIEEITEEKEHYLEINDEYNAQICDCIIEEYKSLLEKE